MHLEQRARERVHRRAAPDARHRRAHALDLDGEDARERRAAPQRDVGGGEAEPAAELFAMGDPTGDEVRVAQQLLGPAHVACLQGRAHRRARDPLALEEHVGHRLQGEPVHLPRRLQRGEVARAPGAEAEVAADDEAFHAQAADEHLVDELARAQGGKLPVESRHMHALDADPGEQLQLVAQPRQARRSGVRGEELPRVRLEGQDAGLQAGCMGGADDALDERAVAPVHPVEVADGQRAPARGRLQRAVGDHHGRGLKG